MCDVCVMFCSTDQVALVVFADDVFNYTIMNLDADSPYAVRVWAFTTMGDQESAQVEVGALGECPMSRGSQ